MQLIHKVNSKSAEGIATAKVVDAIVNPNKKKLKKVSHIDYIKPDVTHFIICYRKS